MKTIKLEETIQSINDRLFSSLYSEISRYSAKTPDKDLVKKLSSVQFNTIQDTLYNYMTAYVLLEELQKDLAQISTSDKNKILQTIEEFYHEAAMLFKE